MRTMAIRSACDYCMRVPMLVYWPYEEGDSERLMVSTYKSFDPAAFQLTSKVG